MHIPKLTLSTLYAHSTTDIINSLHEESKSAIEFKLKGKLFISVKCMYIVSVKSKLQPLHHTGIPQAFDSFAVSGRREFDYQSTI